MIFLTVAITSLIAMGVISDLLFPYEILLEVLEVDNSFNYHLNRSILYIIALGIIIWIFAVGFYMGTIKGELKNV